MRVLDLDFPDLEDILQTAVENGVDFGVLSDAGTVVGVINDAPLASAIIPAVGAAYIKGHTSNLFTKADRSIRDYQNTWDDSKIKDWALLRGSNALLRLIDPFVDENLESLARTDSDEFIRVLNSVMNDKDDSLFQIEKELQQIFMRGKDDPNNIEPEKIVNDLKYLFDVETDNEAIRLYSLYIQIFKDFNSRCGRKQNISDCIDKITTIKSNLLDEIVNISLKNQNFEQLTIERFEALEPYQNKRPIHSWIYGFTFAEIAARTDDGDPYYFKHHLDDDDIEIEFGELASQNKHDSSIASLGSNLEDESNLPRVTEEEKSLEEIAKETYENFSEYIISKLRKKKISLLLVPREWGKVSSASA